MKVPYIPILIDTREQEGHYWTFASYPCAWVTRGTMRVGDYGLYNLPQAINVEAKRGGDLISSMVGKEREKMGRRLTWMSMCDNAWLISDMTADELRDGDYYSQLKRQSAWGLWIGWHRDFPKVHFSLAGTHAEELCYDALRMAWRGYLHRHADVRRNDRAWKKAMDKSAVTS